MTPPGSCSRPRPSILRRRSGAIDTSPITGAELANKTLTPNGSVKQMAEWFVLTCEEAGADAKDLA